jgi:hypothetical protein
VKLQTILKTSNPEEQLLEAIGKLECPELEERFRAVYDAAKFVHERIKSDPGEFWGFVAGLTHSVQVLVRQIEQEGV